MSSKKDRFPSESDDYDNWRIAQSKIVWNDRFLSESQDVDNWAASIRSPGNSEIKPTVRHSELLIRKDDKITEK